MGEFWTGNRRSVLRLVLASLFAGAARAVAKPQPSWCARYRVNATVIVACVPIFSKQNVGGAQLSVEQSGEKNSTQTRLEFAAGTWPERLRGFNRFGATRETVREENCTVAESSYVSFMASSREKNFSEARKAFADSPDAVPLTIARGISTHAGCTFAIEHCAAPANSSWRNCLELTNTFDRFPLSPATQPEGFSGQALPTFLFAVRNAMLARTPETTTPYVHNGQIYHLHARSNGEAVTCRISGQTEFKLWFGASDRTGLPTKIEFRPKSFLKLTLEQEQG